MGRDPVFSGEAMCHERQQGVAALLDLLEESRRRDQELIARELIRNRREIEDTREVQRLLVELMETGPVRRREE